MSGSARRAARTGVLAVVAIAATLAGAMPGNAAPTTRRTHPKSEVVQDSRLGQLPAPPRPAKQPKHHVKPVTPRHYVTAVTPSKSAALAAPLVAAPSTLVLYDRTGTWGWLGELYGEQTANLVSHFGTYTAEPVAAYTAGQLASYSAVVYIGSTYDEPIPSAFLADVLGTTKPVLWMGDNIWQLTAADPTFTTDYGWNWTGFDFSTVNSVVYKGTALTRDGTNNQGGILNLSVSDPTRATVLATAVRAAGTTFPWATRAKTLTYVGEIPYSYEGMTDRYLALSDILFDELAPTTATQHRALVRIEDVNPSDDPTQLRAIADYLFAQHVPFSFGVIPVYTDPKGFYNNGVPQTITLSQAPQVVSALKYMISKGGTIIDHGYTHQYSNVANPYTGVSADDFEFYLSHIDAQNFVRLDTPVPGDSQAWAAGRLNSAATQFQKAGLPQPTIWETPHYAASAADYAAFAAKFSTRYERALYFGGQLQGTAPDYTHVNGQFFPYVVKDLYGSKVIPENIGNDEPTAQNNNPPHTPADIVAAAKANLVVRNGFASFFYHPYLGTADLQTIVTGIKAAGYTFVAPGSV